jgi:chemotaxis signal transduction protein
MELENPSTDALNPSVHQYIVTQVGDRRLAFPNHFVDGLLLLERSQILALPFYHPAVAGLVHHQGKLIPIVALQQLLEKAPGQLPEVFKAVQLSEDTGMAGVGLVIDQMQGEVTSEQLSSDSTIEPFQTELVPSDLWQPQRWGVLTA